MTELPTTGSEDREDGFALLTVIVTMSVLMVLVLAATTFAAASVPTSRRAQDYAASMAAAQAGVEDFLARLNTCDTHWANPCPGASKSAAEGAWVVVPGSDGSKKAEYTYTVVSTPETTPGLIRLRASGRIGGVTRSVTVDLRKDGFLQFIYYTDKESLAPALLLENQASDYPPTSRAVNYSFNGGRAFREDFGGLDAASAQACGRYYYATTSTPGTRGAPMQTKTIQWRSLAGVVQPPVQVEPERVSNNVSCDIQFTGGDVITGPLYSNDALLLNKNGSKLPLFKGPVQTFWQTSYSPSAPAAKPWRTTTSAGPDPTGFTPTIASQQLALPPTNAAIRDKADPAKGGQGCLYTGPTSIVLKNNGTMDVVSPTTTSTNPGCGPGTGLSLPKNGVVYVDRTTVSTCPGNGKSLQTYPIDGDRTVYDCRAGDAFLQGTLKGQLTIATAGDIIVTDDVVYSKQVWNGTTIDTSVTDVLGLVAQGWVRTYHPVDDSTNGNELARSQVKDLEIDAAILSVDNSFTVQWFNKGSGLGTLKIRGGIYQRYRGPVGTGSGNTGYLKDYVYDTRLTSLPPPYFLEPASAPWRVTGLSE